ncbi:RidA family protein [Chitinophaga niabensis]|uniref:Enamine deaminase RidA, house cleaning of reactive enamine intermediates, YjgF/YER057c/UK114 family n=1 Tax=Chitinophaga niabensis TaxID=536979 RepID=A0A1N6DJ27_9BACT|nr:RidA family protein [Chitinophaga niabensis]SIN70758.1 Enamine deaminase RidA, house cleaning of reactive enamine intermediates, YjgF/YER057c/UK114 family [Chitinophaga niabensis]
MKKRILFLSGLLLATVCSAQTLRYVPGAVIVDAAPLAHTALILPLNDAGKLIGKDDPLQQINQVFSNLSRALAGARSASKDIIKLHVSVTSANLVPLVKEQIAKRFAKGKEPAVSFIVGRLLHPGVLLAMDAVAVSALPGAGVVRSPQVGVLPKGGMVFISGMAADGRLPEATANTMQQLLSTLQFLGLNKEHIVQVRAFVHPVDSTGLVEQEVKAFFSGSPMPPVVYTGWNSKNPLVEIELIAASPSGNTALIEYLTPPGVTPSPVYSKVCRINHGKKIYLSGIYGQGNDIQTQLQTAFDTLKDRMKQCDSDLEHLAKALYYVSSNEISTSLTDIRKKYYNPQRPPAATKGLLSQTGPDGSQILIDMIGVQP